MKNELIDIWSIDTLKISEKRPFYYFIYAIFFGLSLLLSAIYMSVILYKYGNSYIYTTYNTIVWYFTFISGLLAYIIVSYFLMETYFSDNKIIAWIPLLNYYYVSKTLKFSYFPILFVIFIIIFQLFFPSFFSIPDSYIFYPYFFSSLSFSINTALMGYTSWFILKDFKINPYYSLIIPFPVIRNISIITIYLYLLFKRPCL